MIAFLLLFFENQDAADFSIQKIQGIIKKEYKAPEQLIRTTIHLNQIKLKSHSFFHYISFKAKSFNKSAITPLSSFLNLNNLRTSPDLIHFLFLKDLTQVKWQYNIVSISELQKQQLQAIHGRPTLLFIKATFFLIKCLVKALSLISYFYFRNKTKSDGKNVYNFFMKFPDFVLNRTRQGQNLSNVSYLKRSSAGELIISLFTIFLAFCFLSKLLVYNSKNQQIMYSQIMVPKVQKNMLLFLQANIKSLDTLLTQMQTLSFKIKSSSDCKSKKQLKGQAQRIIQKLKMMTTKHNQAIMKITQKQMAEGALKRMKNYLERDFAAILRDVSCFRQIVEQIKEKQGEGECQFYVDSRKRDMAQKIKNFKRQIDDQWDKANGISFSPEFTDQSQVATTLQIRSGASLEQQAMSQLQKQFLAIRMISYKMYEEYTSHGHDDLREDISKIKEEQHKLQKQLVQAKENRGRLLEEQRQLSKQLSELKKCNQAIGRRYFILKDRTISEFGQQQIY